MLHSCLLRLPHFRHTSSDAREKRSVPGTNQKQPAKIHWKGLERPHSVAPEFIAVAPAQFVFKIRGQRDRTSTSFTASSSQRGFVRVTGALMTRVTHTVTRHLTSPLWKVTGNSQVASATAKTLVRRWQTRLRRLFKLADVFNGHAHRFRDTFAVELLLAGVPIERVSILLGHQSVRTTEKHYAPWVRSRQEQLEADLARAWSRDPFVLSNGEVHEGYIAKGDSGTHSVSTGKDGARCGSRAACGFSRRVSYSFYVTPETPKAPKVPGLVTRRLHGGQRALQVVI